MHDQARQVTARHGASHGGWRRKQAKEPGIIPTLSNYCMQRAIQSCLSAFRRTTASSRPPSPVGSSYLEKKSLLSSSAFTASARKMSATDVNLAERGEDDPRIPQPKPQADEGHKPIPETGWEDEVPSKRGGDYEKDFLHKPPYMWNSDKFHMKYERCTYTKS